MAYTMDGESLETMMFCRRHMWETVQSASRFGFLFDNDHRSRIVGTVRLEWDESGVYGRELALVGADASVDWLETDQERHTRVHGYFEPPCALEPPPPPFTCHP